jgi:predicted PurR-regulated permease PerM
MAAVILAFGIALGLYLLYQLKTLVFALIIALTLASAISPLARRLEKNKIPRVATVICLYLFTIGLYFALALYVAPTAWEQTKMLYSHLPQYQDLLLDSYNQIKTLAGEQNQLLSFDSTDIRAVALKAVNQTLSFSYGVFGLFGSAVLILFLTAYFVIEGKSIWQGILSWLPANLSKEIEPLILPLESRLGGYIRGQLLVSLAAGTFLGVGLTLIGVPYSLLLGIIAGLLNLVPFVGSMITAVLAVTIAISQSLNLALATIGLFALEQWLESTVIVPQLMGKQVSLHPLIVLFAILIGGNLGGIVGALISIPVTSSTLYLVEKFYLKRPNPDQAL